MYRSAIERTTVARPSSQSDVTSYDRVMKAVHWLTLLLVIGAFACIWAARQADSKSETEFIIHLHQSLGLTILGVTIFRLCWRRRAAIPRLPASLPAIQKSAARATEYLLYGLLSVQPIVGILYTNAAGHLVNAYFLGELPVVLGPDKMLAKQLIALHDLVAVLLLIVIGLHAAAALFHHFVRRDDVLNAMLPQWLQRHR
jgi:cytochrome b561